MTDKLTEEEEKALANMPWNPGAGQYGSLVLTKVIPEGTSAHFEPLPKGAIRCTIIIPDFEIDRDRWVHLMNVLTARAVRQP